ncbi:MAG: acetyl-CoA hydrolase/transferase C-terminal domain-containing protein [Pseudomonadota bacterium]
MISINALLERFAPGERIFLPGSSTEPRPLVEAVSKAASELPRLEITHSFLPGINTVPLSGTDNSIQEIALFPRTKGTTSNSIRVLPLSYFGARHYLAAQAFDWLVVQVAPPDIDGQCSLGPSVEFIPGVASKAKHIVGVINHSMPVISGASSLPLSMFSNTIEVDWPLVNYSAGDVDDTTTRIAQWLATLIDDGSTLQVGLGRVPTCLLERLSDIKDIRMHSGLLGDGFMSMANAGLLSETQKHLSCTALGSAGFYQWLAQRDDVVITDVARSHHPGVLAELDQFVAINSALQVDLYGQANLETVADRTVSAVGGAADFCRGARYSKGGKSIIALPSTAANGAVSRVVACFRSGQPVSIGRHDIDYVVTEFGVANLSNKAPLEKARALVDIADPGFREQLLSHIQQNAKNFQ